MSAKISIWGLLGYILAIGIAFLYFRQCKSEGAEIKLVQDSLSVHVKITDSVIKAKESKLKFNDSVIKKDHADSLSYTRQNDSLKTVISILKGKFSVTKDSIGVLYNQLAAFYNAGDTVALRAAYLDLKQQLDLAGSQLFAIQIARDSMDFVKSNEIERLNGVVNTLKGQLDSAFALLNTQIANSRSEEAATQQILTAQKKKRIWDLLEKIGIGIGALFIGSKL